jgi:hypothetical protein
MANKVYPARRSEPRKELRPLEISKMSSLENLMKISSGGQLVEASISGFKITIARDQLIPIQLRKDLSLDSLVGMNVLIHLMDLNLEVSGRVTRTRFVGKKSFELGIDYSDDAPEYWRECLVDLLPRPGELEEN